MKKTLFFGCLLLTGMLYLAFTSTQASGSAVVSEVTPTILLPSAPALGSVTGHEISQIFEPAVQYWGSSIVGWVNENGLDPNLAATVMQIESCGDPQAESSAGAMGLFQVMPFHFTSSDDPYDPDTNAKRGLAYLKRSLDAAGGNPRLAFAGYNGGIGVIGRPESSWAGQTQRYAYWGSGIYADATNGVSVSPRLEEWFRTQGVSLCRQAAKRLGIKP